MADSIYWESNSAPHGMTAGLLLVDISAGDHVMGAKQGFGMSTVDGGAIKFDDVLGETHTISFPAGGGVECGIAKVYATGTTATNIYVGVIG